MLKDLQKPGFAECEGDFCFKFPALLAGLLVSFSLSFFFKSRLLKQPEKAAEPFLRQDPVAMAIGTVVFV